MIKKFKIFDKELEIMHHDKILSVTFDKDGNLTQFVTEDDMCEDGVYINFCKEKGKFIDLSCTGFNDKYGREIYDRDLLICEEEEIMYEVTFCQRTGQWMVMVVELDDMVIELDDDGYRFDRTECSRPLYDLLSHFKNLKYLMSCLHCKEVKDD